MSQERKAVVLLSGGLDSSTTLAVARSQGFALFALTFRYGQRHEVEVDAARKIARQFGVEAHVVLEIDLRQFGGSALTGDLDVPTGRSEAQIAAGIPLTYVPARNTIFLSFALGWAEVLGTGDIFAGMNAIDYSGYPDCRPEYIAAFSRLANLATRAGVEGTLTFTIHTPLIDLSKAAIIARGIELGVDFGLTTSCYSPDAESAAACGQCDACLLRLKGFAENGLRDPIPYVTQSARL